MKWKPWKIYKFFQKVQSTQSIIKKNKYAYSRGDMKGCKQNVRCCSQFVLSVGNEAENHRGKNHVPLNETLPCSIYSFKGMFLISKFSFYSFL